MNAVQVYTDGSHWNGKGGYGAVFIYVKEGKKHIKKISSTCHYVDTTSVRMEIRPILGSLKRIKTGFKIDIYTDSEHCVNVINKWLAGWVFHGNLKAKANPDLWIQVWDELRRHRKEGSKIRVNWIRGHAGNTFNELADTLAAKGRLKFNVKTCKTRMNY